MCTMPNYYGKSHMRNPYLHVISLSKVIIHWKPLLLFSVKSTVSGTLISVFYLLFYCIYVAVSMEVHISETTTVELGIVPDGEAALREYISNKTSAGSGRKVLNMLKESVTIGYFIQDYDDPFHVVDLGRVLELHRDWVTALPTITPFYAIKCNNDPALLKTLAALGTGFDCASKVCTCRLDLLFFDLLFDCNFVRIVCSQRLRLCWIWGCLQIVLSTPIPPSKCPTSSMQSLSMSIK